MAEADLMFETIQATGLTPDSLCVWQGIPYIWANQQYGAPHRVFAYYLFTYHETAEQWRKWTEWGDHFVSEVIEPVYFRLANDISWNIYWISVLREEELRKVDPRHQIAFTSNTEYTRNLLFSLEHLSEAIPIGRISVDATDEKVQQPSDIWLTQLENKGMSFCLDEYAKKNLDAYLDGKTESQKSTISSIDVVDGQHLTKLRSIFIPRGFRAHCYPKDWNVPFRNVNLLYGLNGSGKTSLLSAIELAMTGEVRSIQDNASQSESIQATPVLSVEVDGRSVALAPPLKPAKKKERERQFYRNRSTNRTHPQLQNLFHRFNYLSAEETFLFARNQPKLTELFSQILYGPETQEMWRNVQNYTSKCADLIAKYEDNLETLQIQVDALTCASSVDVDSFEAYLAASGLNFGQGAGPEKILVETQRLLAEYDKVKSFDPVPSRAQLAEARDVQKEQLSVLSAEYERLTEILASNIEKERSLTQEIERDTELCATSERTVSSLYELVPLIMQLRFHTEHLNRFAAYQDYIEQLKALETTANRLRTLKEKYGSALEMAVEATPQQLREQIRQMQQQRFRLQTQMDDLETQIDQKELDQEKQATLFSALSAAGLELYQMNATRHTCPLCGTEGITEQVLQEHLQRESALGDQQLQTLYQMRQNVRNQYETVKSTLKQLNNQEIIAQTYHEALQNIRQDFPDIRSSDALHKAITDTQEACSKVKSEFETIKSQLVKEVEQASVSGTLEEICKSRQIFFDSIPSQCAEHFDPEESNETLIKVFFSLLQHWEKNQGEFDAALSQKKAEQEQLQKELQQIGQNQRQVEQQLENLKKDTVRLERLAIFWDTVGGTAVDPALNGAAIQTLCENLHRQAREIMIFTENKVKKESYQKKIDDIQKKLGRCYKLRDELECLQSPDSYADAFIYQNIKQISRIFLALHSPQEFSRLDIVDGQLVAFRNEEKVSINHMSTGQRTALVISVFFQMNLATPFVPNFLLLDEPVANIDDLNVLALMDFLREIAVTHRRQIFFTTANQNVAKLFRRKFSFLESDFQELRFFREEEHSLQITKRIYDQSRLLKNEGL